MAYGTEIEVYEWTEGASRPGTTSKPRVDLLDLVDVPNGAQIPAKDDVIVLTSANVTETRYRVIEREVVWERATDPDRKGARFVHLRIFVQQLADETK